jgi:hypothetical protein
MKNSVALWKATRVAEATLSYAAEVVLATPARGSRSSELEGYTLASSQEVRADSHHGGRGHTQCT